MTLLTKMTLPQSLTLLSSVGDQSWSRVENFAQNVIKLTLAAGGVFPDSRDSRPLTLTLVIDLTLKTREVF